MGTRLKEMNDVGGLAPVGGCCGGILDLESGSYLKHHLVRPLKGAVMETMQGEHLAQHHGAGVEVGGGERQSSGCHTGAGKGS